MQITGDVFLRGGDDHWIQLAAATLAGFLGEPQTLAADGVERSSVLGAVAAGVAYDVTPGVSLRLGYRGDWGRADGRH